MSLSLVETGEGEPSPRDVQISDRRWTGPELGQLT